MMTRMTVVELRQAVAKGWDELAACRVELIATRTDRDAAREHAIALAAEVARFRGLQGLSVRLAWWLQRLRNCFPWAARVTKRLVTWR